MRFAFGIATMMLKAFDMCDRMSHQALARLKSAVFKPQAGQGVNGHGRELVREFNPGQQ
jgi:hypothetical protein